jgi:predicted porin
LEEKMKKAFVGVLVVVSVFAFLTVSVSANPRVYGRLHLSMDYLSNTADGGLNLSSNSSRLGFKGDLEISSSLKAIYQLEGTVDVDIRGGQIATRDSFGGLKGDFGTVRLGYFDTPLKTVRSRTDFFGDQIGDARNMTLGNDLRFRNSLGYTTPKLGPLTIDTQLSMNQAGAATADNEDWALSASAFIREDSLYAAVAYEVRADGAVKESAIRAGLQLNLDPIKISGFFQTFEGDMTIGGGILFGMGDIDLKGQFYMVSSEAADACQTYQTPCSFCHVHE